MNSSSPSSSSSSSSSLLSSLLPRPLSSVAAAYDVEEPHVLAVDDNRIDRILVEKLLKDSSCKVTTAENGQRALEYLGLVDEMQNSLTDKASKVNMIITDYCMPGMTGYDLLKKIKESSVLKDVPVVVVSSENVPTRINKCLEEGAKMFMLKPLKRSDVKKMRHQLLCNAAVKAL